MVIQIFEFINKKRSTSTKEYNTYEDFERELLLLKLSGTWVGHRVFYNINLGEFLTLSETEINNLPSLNEFDRASYISHTTGANQ